MPPCSSVAATTPAPLHLRRLRSPRWPAIRDVPQRPAAAAGWPPHPVPPPLACPASPLSCIALLRSASPERLFVDNIRIDGFMTSILRSSRVTILSSTSPQIVPSVYRCSTSPERLFVDNIQIDGFMTSDDVLLHETDFFARSRGVTECYFILIQSH